MRIRGPGTTSATGLVADVVDQIDKAIRVPAAKIVPPVAASVKKAITVAMPPALTGTDATDIRNLHAKLSELIQALRSQ
jgi:hypothetical protein